MKILIAVDGSPYTQRVLAYLAAHPQFLGAQHQYSVIHTVLAVPPGASAFLSAAMKRNYYAQEAEAIFEPVRKFLEQQKIVATFVTTLAHPGDSIARLAREGGFDLVVMGSHGHGELRNLVLGSTVTAVLALCTTPVLIVR